MSAESWFCHAGGWEHPAKNYGKPHVLKFERNQGWIYCAHCGAHPLDQDQGVFETEGSDFVCMPTGSCGGPGVYTA